MKLLLDRQDGYMETLDEEMQPDESVILHQGTDRTARVFVFDSYVRDDRGEMVPAFREVVPHVIARFPSEVGPPVTGGGSGA